MLAGNVLTLMLALVPPTAQAAPSATPRVLKTIVTVVSTPYCNSLEEHFNGALVPMLANDRTLDGVSLQLDDLNTLFSQPDYVERFLHVRDQLGRQATALNASLTAIQQQIDQLRDGERLTTDQQAANQLHQAAQELQTAYDKQKQLAIDLQGMHQAMLDCNIMRARPALGGFDPAEMSEPADMRDVKSYLRFDGQRDVINRSENNAVDLALAIAQTRCTTTKQ